MTYCIGIKSESGVIALADTRISSGLGVSTSKKIFAHQESQTSFFIMSSGLRSIRDKVMHYFEDEYSEHHADKLYKIVNLLGAQIRRVRDEDLEALKKSSFMFDSHFIVGGQCEHDKKSSIFLVFPEGNWVEVSDETPYAIIGNTGFGKPILTRLLHNQHVTFKQAIKAAYLSFDATFKNASDVDFPLDFILLKDGSFDMQEFRKEEDDLREFSKEWHQRLTKVANELPDFIDIEE